MNYSWANPSTGIREQVATKEEARLLAWEEVQKAAKFQPISFLSVGVFEQEAAGWASKAAYEQLPIDPWPDGYAFSNPKDGARESYRNFANAAERIADEWPEHYNRTCSSQAPVDQVTIYRQRLAFEVRWDYRQQLAFEVRWDDPKPELPTPPVIPPDTPSSLIHSVMEGSCADLGRAQLLAMLWIAEALHGEFMERRIDPAKPHVFEFGHQGQVCKHCGFDSAHAIHGYTSARIRYRSRERHGD